VEARSREIKRGERGERKRASPLQVLLKPTITYEKGGTG
jgi:hypothetical protein